MKFFSLISIPPGTALGWGARISQGKTLHAILEVGKMVVIIVIAFFLSQEYIFPPAQSSQKETSAELQKDFSPLPSRENFSPSGQSSQRKTSAELQEDFSPPNRSTHDRSAKEILNLAAMIRFITDRRLSEGKSLRYAGLIFHAAQKNGVNSLEIIALIMAESQFKEASINAKSGDYGLGQINWHHWGKDLGLTHKDLLDPAINIYMTCHVYNYYGRDFGKYHRGHGVKSQAYVLNVKGILSSLNAFAKKNQEEVS